MATKSVDEQSPAPVKEANPRIDEVMVCRLLAILEKKFGPVEGARPKLTLIQGGRAS